MWRCGGAYFSGLFGSHRESGRTELQRVRALPAAGLVEVFGGRSTNITLRLQNSVIVDDINQTLSDACEKTFMGVMDFTLQEWVSSDIIGNPYSAIIDGLSTRGIGDRTVKLQVWYDNEYGYACLLLDLLKNW
ncbi:hypothetical protein O0V09_16395 [Dasania sp. GY-19]|uniref:Glyceraldehyde 3-phosphate dehydrogenase catalytic domain-containing protein n=1 Tax=Dasania phycosphaerae TaxID=2950436 RepID=A0A9J6RR79_9GAMM|nr:hypothetical protein [Dasania phycosphaerae]MCZ0866793.1 hypothetical protein [Dasania phycosphaerae]